jgi:hypothetical protein
VCANASSGSSSNSVRSWRRGKAGTPGVTLALEGEIQRLLPRVREGPRAPARLPPGRGPVRLSVRLAQERGDRTWVGVGSTAASTITLPDSKNGDGRVLVLAGELGDLMKRWEQARLRRDAGRRAHGLPS